jgi:two-component system, OmpR family, KDP operon response regulator KdpE
LARNILVIEPEPAILRLIQLLLSNEDYEVTSIHADDEAASNVPDIDLVLIDIAPPYEEFLGTLDRIRAGETTPIVAMSASIDDEVRHAIAESGADDFMTSPFDPDELVSRVRFLLGEQEEVYSDQRPLSAGRLEVDFNRRTVSLDTAPVKLSRSEWIILDRLASQPGHPCLMAELLTKTWGAAVRHDNEFLKLWIQRLQQKLGCDPARPRLIRPYHNVGYVLSP